MGTNDDATKVDIASMYFIGVTHLWWHSRSIDEKRGGITISAWVEFQKEIKEQFYPEYAEDKAQAKLH